MCCSAFVLSNNESEIQDGRNGGSMDGRTGRRERCLFDWWMFDFVNLMCHGNAQFHIRPTAKYVVDSCVCVAMRLRSRTINPFDFVNLMLFRLPNRWLI